MELLRSRGFRVAAGVAVFASSAFLGFNYKIASAPPLAEEPYPSEEERRRVFAATAAGKDREVFLQELLLGIGRWRRQLVQQAEGNVLEVAAGTGRNFRFYNKKKVERLTVADFCRPMLQIAMDKKDALDGIPCSFRLANSCKLPDEDEVYNSVVETFALCSYEDPVKTLKELKRVLKKARRHNTLFCRRH